MIFPTTRIIVLELRYIWRRVLNFYLLVSVSGHEVSTKSVRLSYFSSEFGVLLLRARLFDISGQVNEAIGNRANIKRRSISKLADSWSSFKL